MKRKKKPSRATISALLVKLDSAHNALEAHKNFNLAEVWIGEYFSDIPPYFMDKRMTKSMYNALRTRNAKLLFAAIEAEQERLGVEKIKMLRDSIVDSALSESQ